MVIFVFFDLLKFTKNKNWHKTFLEFENSCFAAHKGEPTIWIRFEGVWQITKGQWWNFKFVYCCNKTSKFQVSSQLSGESPATASSLWVTVKFASIYLFILLISSILFWCLQHKNRFYCSIVLGWAEKFLCPLQRFNGSFSKSI